MDIIKQFEKDVTIILGSEIKQILTIEDHYIVLGNHIGFSKSNIEDNVCAFRSDGSYLWRIKKKKFFDHQNSYYSNIFTENKKLFLYNTSGVLLNIDYKTGDIISEELAK